MYPRISRAVMAVMAVGAVMTGLGPTALAAHDIPARVTVLSFLKAEGRTLRVLVRVPLAAMRDVNFPLTGPGYLDFGRADSLLFDAASLWVAGGMTLQENGRELQDPRIAAIRVSLPSDRSFASYDSALAHVTGAKLPATTELIWQQALLDVLLEYSIWRIIVTPEVLVAAMPAE